jgi:hypothetical protein
MWSLGLVKTSLTPAPEGGVSPLYIEHTTNKNEHHRNTEGDMLRIIIETAAEITSLVVFGSAIAIWSLVLSPLI